MKTPTEALRLFRDSIKTKWMYAFISTLIIGLLTHMPIMLADIPNHDGLASMYFDQNMITSGRWFLAVPCSISSFFTIPWIIGLLALLYLSITSVLLTEILDLDSKLTIILVSGVLVTFPTIASNFAYVFTFDGYMFGLMLAVLAVLLTKKGKLGFIYGGIALAFSLGIYQAYVPVTIVLSIFSLVVFYINEDSVREKVIETIKYIAMGGIGFILYLVLLKVLLFLQGKELDTYQGINSLSTGNDMNLLASLKSAYVDFIRFTFKSKVLFNNIPSLIAFFALLIILMIVLIFLIFSKRLWKNIGTYFIMVMLVLALPIAMNAIMFISKDLTYHLLMRMQWAFLLICIIAFIEKYRKYVNSKGILEWALILSLVTLVSSFAICDNIGYSNLMKKYEKTYGYCMRLLDRIEQTEGYYKGMPIALVGVVSNEQYPTTDITEEVTGSMIGLTGDYLLYTSANYETFIRNYLGASLNILTPEEMKDIYYSEEYTNMPSFPLNGSVKIVDGIMYIKTENFER